MDYDQEIKNWIQAILKTFPFYLHSFRVHDSLEAETEAGTDSIFAKLC